ncbi:P-loop NTPase [Caproiciproducens galactitolivorans]|uniref:nucleotide-binding protein n=1 Tax=Caproiciproducens galactitolivorans TaxID=642589 RepID=UPI00240A2FA5|nr:P-loop NTPase [Caproiciproducens galactitolivorans]
MGAITVITSGKGGVGKSTITSGLGLALSQRGKRVLLIDGDAGLGCLDHMLGIEENKVFDIADVVSGRVEPMKAIYPCPFAEGLFVIPAPATEEDLISPDIMKQLVSVLSRYYDHVLIDCPAGIGGGFQSAAAAAPRALVVSTPDPVCLNGARKTRMLLEQGGVRQQRLIINRFSTRNFRTQNFYPDLDSVIDAAGIRLIAVVPEDPLLAAAAANSAPVSPKSIGAMALGRLAARLEGEHVPLASLQKF